MNHRHKRKTTRPVMGNSILVRDLSSYVALSLRRSLWKNLVGMATALFIHLLHSFQEKRWMSRGNDRAGGAKSMAHTVSGRHAHNVRRAWC